MISSFQIIDSLSLQSLPTQPPTPTPTQSPLQSQSQPQAEYSIPPNP
jgi:hypothetical protein